MNTTATVPAGPLTKDEQIRALQKEVRRLTTILNTPLYEKFLEAVQREAAHQVFRWGAPPDRQKEPQDWFWLIGYLSGKALRAHVDGNKEKALHHTISSAAALMNWHSAITAEHHDAGTPIAPLALPPCGGPDRSHDTGELNAEQQPTP
ncbi:MAG: hypothetical protein OXB94_01195 [Nitrospira sp.]|nr:hypothetical protein [Nitrospira sp.]